MRIFLLLFICISLNLPELKAQNYFYKQFKGRIGNRDIRVELIKAPSKNNPQFNLRGTYYYERIGKNITLTNGSLDPVGNLYLEEGVKGNDSYDEEQSLFIRTGTFNGTYYSDSQTIEGRWTSTNGQQTYPFVLNEDYSNSSIPAEIIFNDLNYENAEIRFHYPEFRGRNTAPQINNFIQNELMGDMQSKMTEFIGQYREVKSLGGMLDFFESSTICFIIHNENNILCLNNSQRSYTGGAHGNYRNDFYCFNIENGERLSLEDLLASNYETELTRIVEAQLRNSYGIRADQSLADFGFSLPNGKFYLSKNFYINREGLGFYYNVYDIAPYAAGSQDVFIPYGLIKHFIIEDSLLDRYVN